MGTTTIPFILEDIDTRFALPIICPRTNEVVSAETLYNRHRDANGQPLRINIADLVFDNFAWPRRSLAPHVEKDLVDAVRRWTDSVRAKIALHESVAKATDGDVTLTATDDKAKITADNPHREYFPAYQLSYWWLAPDGTAYDVACARDEAEVVRLEQHIPNDGTRTVTEVWLRHPQNAELLEKLRAALDVAFAAGRAAKAKELREALEIKP